MRWLLCAALALGAGCQPADFEVGPGDGPLPLMPRAHAGTGTTVPIDTTVTLDGSASRDLDGSVTFSEWRLIESPSGSNAFVAEPNALLTTATLNAPGVYTFTLTVTDDDGNVDTEAVTFAAEAPRISVNAGPDVDAMWHSRVQLRGRYELEMPGPVSVIWRFLTVPDNDTEFMDDDTTLTPSFVANKVGDYIVEMGLFVNGEYVTDQLLVRVTLDQQDLADGFTAAEWSSTVARFVMLDPALPAVVLHDPVGGSSESIPLGAGATPSDVAIDPAGTRAVVPRGNQIVILDLATESIVGTVNASAPSSAVFDAVFANQDRVHLFRRDAADGVRTVDLATSAVATTSTPFPPQSDAVLRPTTSEVYSFTPTLLTQWDGATTPMTHVRSRELLEPDGRSMFFSPTGTFAITRSGVVLLLADLSFRASLQPELDVFRAAHSPLRRRIVVAGDYPAVPGEQLALNVFTDAFNLYESLDVPASLSSATVLAMALDAAGTRVFIVLRTGSNVSVLTVPL